MNDVAWPTLIDLHPDVKPTFEFVVLNVAVLDEVVWPKLVTYPDSCPAQIAVSSWMLEIFHNKILNSVISNLSRMDVITKQRNLMIFRLFIG